MIEKESEPDTNKLVVQVPVHAQITQKLYSFKWLEFEKYLAFIGGGFYALQQVIFGFKSSALSQKQKELNQPVHGVIEGLFGFLKDNSDGQWRAFSSNIDILILCATIFLGLSHWIKSLQTNKKNENLQLFLFQIAFGFVFATYLFRAGILYWLFFTALNFLVIQVAYNWKVFPWIIWTLNIVIIFMNDFSHGYSMQSLFPGSQFAQWVDDSKKDAPTAWQYSYNMSILRIISFGIDKHWSYFDKRQQSESDHKKKCKICTKFVTCLRLRYDQSHSIDHYNFITFAAYMLYTPIFITGPPLVFNAWYSQMAVPQNTHSRKQKISYTIRTILNFIGLEIWIHVSHSFALSTIEYNEVFWEHFSAPDLLLLGFTTLMFIWFKFNTIWKIARCWALWDDVEAPENMNRCIFNNYNFEGFWRSWHRGFNQWLIRYIFIPLGGSKNKLWNIWFVFTFVAIWHDINLNLLFWAWGICLCMMPEVFVKNYFKKEKYRYLWKLVWWKYVCCALGALWIYFMCITNLIGFGMGYKILDQMFEKMENAVGLFSFFMGFVLLMFEALFQFYLRELEDDEEKGF